MFALKSQLFWKKVTRKTLIGDVVVFESHFKHRNIRPLECVLGHVTGIQIETKMPL